jgi:hypothetical protein
MVASRKGLGPEKDRAGKGQHHMQKTEPPHLGLDTKTVSRNVTWTETNRLLNEATAKES